MGRKADINNLIKEAERRDQRVIEIEKMLEAAKNDSVGAWDKVSIRRNELEQENNNGLSKVVKEVFWTEITPDELRSKWDELLLITEVKEYVESERAKHNAELEEKKETHTNDDLIYEKSNPNIIEDDSTEKE